MHHCLLTGILALFMLLTSACSAKHYSLVKGDKLFFYLQSDGAAEVAFASSADQFRYHFATAVRDGLWEVAVPMQEEFTYFYLVDGQVTLPVCQLTVEDDFGSKNCLFIAGM